MILPAGRKRVKVFWVALFNFRRRYSRLKTFPLRPSVDSHVRSGVARSPLSNCGISDLNFEFSVSNCAFDTRQGDTNLWSEQRSVHTSDDVREIDAYEVRFSIWSVLLSSSVIFKKHWSCSVKFYNGILSRFSLREIFHFFTAEHLPSVLYHNCS